MPPLPAVDLTLLSAGAGNYYPKDGGTVAVHYVMRVRRDGRAGFRGGGGGGGRRAFRATDAAFAPAAPHTHARDAQRPDGSLIDDSYARKRPMVFGVGMGCVMPGWNEVVKQMSVGDKAQCVLKPHLMYSQKGLPGLIAPDSDIHLEIELITIQTSEDTSRGVGKRPR